MPVSHAQQVHELLANLEREKYWAEQIKDACFGENQILRQRLSLVCRAHLEHSKKMGEKEQRVLELVMAHQGVQQERDNLLIEKADIKSQLDAEQAAYRQLQEQLEASDSDHAKKIEEMQQALSSEQFIAGQLGLDKSNLKAALIVKEKKLNEIQSEFTKWTMDLEEQLKEIKEANRDKDASISNLKLEVAKLMKAQEMKEKDLEDMKMAFAEEKTRLCNQLKGAENTLRNIHKLSEMPQKVDQ
ncbi:MAG: hypothetical protein Q9195_008418 [Heterodermia aff. obscurata]